MSHHVEFWPLNPRRMQPRHCSRSLPVALTWPWTQVILFLSSQVIKKKKNLGISKVVVETDSMLAQLALTTSTFSLAPVGGIVYEIKYLMNLFFNSLQVVFCPRDCNRVAHAVAAFGCKCPPDTVVSWDGMPPGLEDLVTSDITESSV